MVISVPKDLRPWPSEPLALNSVEVTAACTIFREHDDGRGFAVEIEGCSTARREIWRAFALPDDAVLRGTLALRALDLERSYEVRHALADLDAGIVQWNELRVRRADLLLYPDLIEWKSGMDAAQKREGRARTTGGRPGRPKGWRAPGPLMELAGLALATWLHAKDQKRRLSQRSAIDAVADRFSAHHLLPGGDDKREEAIQTVLTYMKRIRSRLGELASHVY